MDYFYAAALQLSGRTNILGTIIFFISYLKQAPGRTAVTLPQAARMEFLISFHFQTGLKFISKFIFMYFIFAYHIYDGFFIFRKT